MSPQEMATEKRFWSLEIGKERDILHKYTRKEAGSLDLEGFLCSSATAELWDLGQVMQLLCVLVPPCVK